jgi:two-component system cell cycle sensor histidine kinase/response regulator CckA
LRDGLGKPAGVIAYSIDVTERKRLEEQLLQAQKLEAIGQLAGGVAHDFNNLMAIITAHADLLLARLSANDPCRELAEPIKHAGERAAVLTRQLLAFSRKTILDPRVLDLNELIQEASRLLRSVLGEGIELVLALSPELGRVRADPHQLEQVLLNLAVNARDAMPQGGKVTIRTEDVELRSSSLNLNVPVRPGPYVALSLSDTGCGMTPEVQARIFEPFFTTKEVGRGTGLGLAMVYGFVRQSDGHIEVRSEPGQGATFTIYLPRAEDVGAPAPSEPRTEPAQQAQ